MLASLRHARSVLALVLVPSVVGACTSFGAETSGDASAPPDPPPVLPDGARPDPPLDAAGVDATPVDATSPAVDAGPDAAPTPRVCKGTTLFAVDFEQLPLPEVFGSIGARTYVTNAVGFTTQAIRYDIGGNVHSGFLKASRNVSPLTATCVEARISVDVAPFTLQGLEVDVLRLTLGAAVVRAGVAASYGYLIVGGSPAVTFTRPTAGARHWVLRTTASKTWLVVDDAAAGPSAVGVPSAATATLEIGLDTSRATPTSSPTSNVIFDDVFATYE
jgi:hypothetical protein